MHRAAAAFAILAFAASAAAQTPAVAPRPVVERAAQTVADLYWSPEIGADIAADLRGAAAAGAFDRFTDPLDLAAALQERLRPRDGHFQVQWSAAPPADAPQAPPNPAAALQQAARGAYGFAHVEMFPGGVGYVDIRGFAGFTPDNAETSPARAAADAAMTLLSGAQAIIVDQRDCSGGAPAMVAYLVTHFVPPGADIYNTFRSRGPDRYERPFAEPRTPRQLDTPLFILNSGRTASACESFAYTLQAADRATIIGAASAGGANPGGFVPIGEGFTLFVSAGTPVNPITGRNWEGAGVTPDIAFAPGDDALTRARILALEAAAARSPAADAALELDWALTALRAQGVTLPARALRAFAGDYGARRVTIEQGRLVLHRERRPGLVLTPIGEDLFAVGEAAPLQRVRFERDGRGRVTALVLMLANGPQFRDTRIP